MYFNQNFDRFAKFDYSYTGKIPLYTKKDSAHIQDIDQCRFWSGDGKTFERHSNISSVKTDHKTNIEPDNCLM